MLMLQKSALELTLTQKYAYYCILGKLGSKKHRQIPVYYDNTSNYGKKNEVIESCPEFNAEQHFIIPFFR